ncbi:hypothetical protein P7K49_030541 [Saguinus oedipus]|uniref:Leucine-rich repeat-containing protein 43 n=1 Tax=Saguinus oedipus TaxID=9490 RepID=A0ABQ9U2F3_SAGOE|nr:hypothetical protein P7K49_030541 [Saguinus oedipus]
MALAGEQLLGAGEVFAIGPLQLYAVTEQLQQGKPTCASGDAKTDLGHILDFTCRLKYLKVSGTEGPFGTSNIQEQLLPFDLSIFKSLHQVERSGLSRDLEDHSLKECFGHYCGISHCVAKHIRGLVSSKPTLATLSVRFSATSMKEVLVPEASEFDEWEPEGTALEGPVTAVIPTWQALTTLDLSHNSISEIDESVKLIPKIEFLDLSHNGLLVVDNLQHLYNLVHLDLSYNKLSSLEGLHTKLGNIKTLNLAGNLLESLSGLHKLYSLVTLDLRDNRVEQMEEVRSVGSLPCLEHVFLLNNPLSIIPDYRTKVLAQFGERASEPSLVSAAPGCVCAPATMPTRYSLTRFTHRLGLEQAPESLIDLRLPPHNHKTMRCHLLPSWAPDLGKLPVHRLPKSLLPPVFGEGFERHVGPSWGPPRHSQVTSVSGEEPPPSKLSLPQPVVCLDDTVTTEKELDTVEVLKAIQKAKEVKSKLSNPEKKMRESAVCALPAGTGRLGRKRGEALMLRQKARRRAAQRSHP